MWGLTIRSGRVTFRRVQLEEKDPRTKRTCLSVWHWSLESEENKLKTDQRSGGKQVPIYHCRELCSGDISPPEGFVGWMNPVLNWPICTKVVQVPEAAAPPRLISVSENSWWSQTDHLCIPWSQFSRQLTHNILNISARKGNALYAVHFPLQENLRMTIDAFCSLSYFQNTAIKTKHIISSSKSIR